MAIDPTIALGVRQIQPPDQIGTLAKVLQLQAAQQGIRLSDLQYKKLTTDLAEAAATKDAFSKYQRGEISLADVAAINPELVLKLQEAERKKAKDESDIAKNKAETNLKTLEAGAKKAERLATILGSAQDQTTYELALAAAKSEFGDAAVAGVPPQFDPGWTQQKLREAMSAKDRIELQLREARLAFDKDAKTVDQDIAQQNADSQRISAGAAATSAGAAAANARTAADRLALDRSKVNQPEGAPFEVSDKATGEKKLVYRTGTGQLLDANTREPITTAVAPKTPDVTPEGAGKVALMKQGRQDVQAAKALLFDDKGNLRRTVAAFANVGGTAGVGEESRKVFSYIRNAIGAKLRMETGAAAPDSEVTEIARRFLPSWAMDNSESAKDKLDRLQEFMDMGLTELERSGYIPPGAAGSTRAKPVKPQDFGLKPAK